MRCEEAQNDFAEYLAGRLPRGSGLLDHLAVCSNCRGELQELQNLWGELQYIDVPRPASVMQPVLIDEIAKLKLHPKGRKPMPLALKPVLLTIVSLIGALFFGHSFVETTREAAIKLERPLDNPGAHYRGASNAPLTLLQYGDYECPTCVDYNGLMNDVLRRYAGKVRLEFRHFPLPLHKNAIPAALAAEAAGQQGKYWEMHDLLFANRDVWAGSSDPELVFAKLASRLGLDAKRFKEAMQSPELRQHIMNDIEAGKAANVQATPTFFLNGRRLTSYPSTLEQFVALIDKQLQGEN